MTSRFILRYLRLDNSLAQHTRSSAGYKLNSGNGSTSFYCPKVIVVGWLEFSDIDPRPILSALPNYLPRSYEKARDVRDISEYLIHQRNGPVVKKDASETRAVKCAEECFGTVSSVFVYQTSLK